LLKAAKAIHNPPKVYGVGMPLGRNPSLENTLGALILGNGGHFCLPRFERRRVRLPEVRETIDMIKELAGKFANAIVRYNKAPAIWGGIGTHGLLKGKNQQGQSEVRRPVRLALPGRYRPESNGGQGVHPIGGNVWHKHDRRRDEGVTYSTPSTTNCSKSV
jgi:hypothetical protein